MQVPYIYSTKCAQNYELQDESALPFSAEDIRSDALYLNAYKNKDVRIMHRVYESIPMLSDLKNDWIVVVSEWVDKPDKNGFEFAFGTKQDFDINRWFKDPDYYPATFSAGSMPKIVARNKARYFHICLVDEIFDTSYQYDGMIKVSVGTLVDGRFSINQTATEYVLNICVDETKGCDFATLWDNTVLRFCNTSG